MERPSKRAHLDRLDGRATEARQSSLFSQSDMDVFSYQSVRLDGVLVVLLIIVGVVANSVTIGAILRTKLRRYAQSQYLLALLPVRQLMLVVLTNVYLPNLWQNNYMGCIMVEMIGSFSSFTQGWLMVIMCAEPIVQSYLPQSTKMSRRRSQLFIFCVGTVAIVFALFSAMKTTPTGGDDSEPTKKCYWKQWRLVSICHAIVCLMLPLVGTLAFSAWRPPRSSLTDEDQDTQQASSQRRKQRQAQPERIRFVAAFAHFFLVLPFYTLFGFAAAIEDVQVSTFFHTLAFYFLYIDLASSLPLYCLCWPQFRKSLNACWWSEDGPTTAHPPTVRPRKPRGRSSRKRKRRRRIHKQEQLSEPHTSELVTDIVSL